MEINDFSAIIQFTATVCIAFVTVEYVKSFIDVLCERFFKCQEFIINAFQECRDKLADKNTLENINAVDINGKSTNNKIEEAKRENEILRKDISDMEEQIKKELKSTCQVRSMSSLCFLIFLESVLILLVGGVEKRYIVFSHSLVVVLTFFSVIYLFIGWIRGEKDAQKYILTDFSSLKQPFYWFFISILFSIVILLVCSIFLSFESLRVCENTIDDIWWWSLVIYIIFSYLNFFVFALKINNKAEDFKKKVKDSKSVLIERCEAANKNVEKLQAASDLGGNELAVR